MSFLSETIIRWKARRELRKAAPILKKIADETPSSFLEGLLCDKNGTPLDQTETRNALYQMANRALEKSRWI
jgi:hypothetical protein